MAEEPQFTHLSERGEARMVDVSDKQVTARRASALGVVGISAECAALLRSGGVPKGDAYSVARIAGIMAAKNTAQLIPLCHPLPLTGTTVEVELVGETVEIRTSVKTTSRTGVEMEALTAAAVACCAFIDMVKGVDRLARIERVEVVTKSGGRSGDWSRQTDGTNAAGSGDGDNGVDAGGSR